MELLAAEMQRLLKNLPFGGLSALARSVGITSASVSAWRRGIAVPSPDKWRAIEDHLSLPVGYLESVVANEQRPTEPRVSQLDATSAELARRIDVLQEQLTRLTGVVAEQRTKLDAQGVEIERLSTRGRRAAG